MLGNAFGNLVTPRSGALSDGPIKTARPIKPAGVMRMEGGGEVMGQHGMLSQFFDNAAGQTALGGMVRGGRGNGGGLAGIFGGQRPHGPPTLEDDFWRRFQTSQPQPVGSTIPQGPGALTDIIGGGPRPPWWPEDRAWPPYGGFGGGDKPQVATGGIGAIVEPIKPISPGTLSPPDNVFAPNPGVTPFGMELYGQEAGGGGGMAHGGRVGALRFEEGGEVDGGIGDAGSQGERDNTEGGDLSGALGGLGGYGLEGIDSPLDFGAPPSTAMERGLMGLLGSVVGLPGLGLAASIAEKLADLAEKHGVPTDRDPATGISAGGTTGALAGPQGAPELGYRGPGVPLQGGPRGENVESPAPGALTDPGEALPALSVALPALALRQPIINPLTYGYGPAAGWLR